MNNELRIEKIIKQKINFILTKHMTKNPEEKKSDVPACCAGCVRWEKFGKDCFYYWEGKKHCTMWTGSWDEVIVQ